MSESRTEIQQLRDEVAQLKALVSQLAGAGPAGAIPPVTAEAEGKAMSRRGLLRALPAAAAVGVVATAGSAITAQPAAAAAGAPWLLGRNNTAGSETTHLYSKAEDVLVISDSTDPNTGVKTAISPATIKLHTEASLPGPHFSVDISHAPFGSAYFAIDGTDFPDPLVRIDGYTSSGRGEDGGAGLRVTATASDAVQAVATSGSTYNPEGPNYEDAATALSGTATGNSKGLRLTTERGSAIESSTTDASATTDAVVVTSAGLGRSVFATSTNPKNPVGAITGVTKGTGSALWGTIENDTSTAPAVVGLAGAKDRGGRFKGGAAAINLAPSTAATHPATGATGDLFLDSTARLWLCKGGAAWTQLG